METARVFISLPFRTEGLAAEHPGCLKTFDGRQIDRFLTALFREIGSISSESDDLLVQEIEFGNGSAAHFTADDLARMVRIIKEQFHVSPQAKIKFTVTPSGFDFYKLNSMRQMGSSICFEIPALTDEGLQAGGYHCTAEKAKAALECCFQNGFRHYSVYLCAKSMEREEVENTLKTLLALRPEAIQLRKDADGEFLKNVSSILSQAAWNCKENCWYRGAVPKQQQCSVQIGCGPNAVSIFENTALRSTADFDFYCSHSDDFEALVGHAAQDDI